MATLTCQPAPAVSALAFATACSLVALSAGPASAALAPAEFTESVGIGSFHAAGVDLHAAEVVSLNVVAEDFEGRGGGTGHAWIDPVNPVSTGLRLSLMGGHNPSGIGGTAFTTTRYEFSVIKIDEDAPDWVDLSFSGAVQVSVANSQPDYGRTWFSYGLIWINSYQFAARNYDAGGIYNGVFEQHWDGVALGSFAVGSVNIIELDAYTHGEGAGVGFNFDSTVFIDPTIEFVGPSTGSSYLIEYSPAIVVPEPATWLLLLAGLPWCLRGRARR